MPRKGWAVFIVLVGVPLLLGVGVYVRLRRASQQMERDVRELASTKLERPTLEPVLPGTYEQLTRPLFKQMTSHPVRPWKAAWTRGAIGERYAQVREGKLPLDALPEEAARDIAEFRPWAYALLRATHAARPSQPVDRFDISLEEDRGFGSMFAAKISVSDQLVLLSQGRPGEALRLCLDTVALARDEGLGGGMLDATYGTMVLYLLRYSCGRAIDESSVEEKRAGLADFELIRSGFASPNAWMTNEAPMIEVMACPFAPDDELEALPGNAGSWVEGSSINVLLKDRLRFSFDGLARLKERNRRVTEALALPESERDPSLAAALEDYRVSMGPEQLRGDRETYLKIAHRIERQQRLLDLFGCALELDLAHDETGEWHASERCRPYLQVHDDLATLSAPDPAPVVAGEETTLHLELHAPPN